MLLLTAYVIQLNHKVFEKACAANISFENPLSLGLKPIGTKFAEKHQLIKCRGSRTVFYRYIHIPIHCQDNELN
jgi:hypothetical protein